ncbi:MAG: zeta toxin family protein [Ascidiaceihabitans sp.]|nr:zeta toxin family protein [Ascidiaceihabitans sp.]
MAPAPRPTLVMLAGPNGSGKSTLYETRIAPKFAVPFINADIIQRDELQNSDVNAAYAAAQIATQRRASLLADRKSFATETVFSHPSKLDLIAEAKGLGYRVMTFHISVEHPDLSVARVWERVKEGGHPVPEEKIRNRYDRSGPLIRQAILQSDIGHVFDNSRLNHPPVRALSFANGTLTFALPQLPTWVLDLYEDDLVL